MTKKTHSLIFWKITCVDKQKNKAHRNIKKTFGNEVVSLDRKSLGIFDKTVMLDTSRLSEEQQIMVDIALRRKELLDDTSLFIPLRHLFTSYTNGTNLPCGKMTCIFVQQYHEDEEDNPLNEIQFVQTISRIDHLIQLHDGNYIKDCVFPNDGEHWNIPELTIIDRKDFTFSEEDIWCLNTFINDSFRLSKSPLLSAPHPYTLEIRNNCCICTKSITDEQLTSSLIEFRKLYMENEPCNFLKTMKKMTDRRMIHHPIYLTFNSFRDEYNNFLGKISNIKSLQPPLQMNNVSVDILSDKVTGFNIIKSVLYTGLIHQGEEKERKLRSSIESELKSNGLLEYIFCFLVSSISSIIQESAVFIYNILRHINLLRITMPQASISDAERLFNAYVLRKSYALSEIIWKKRGYSRKGCLQFHQEAKRMIDLTFGINFNIDEDG